MDLSKSEVNWKYDLHSPRGERFVQKITGKDQKLAGKSSEVNRKNVSPKSIGRKLVYYVAVNDLIDGNMDTESRVHQFII
jgi:hypothetical protein